MPPQSRKRPATLTPTTARTVSIATLAAFYLRCKQAYFYTDTPLVDDDTFDAIEAVFRERAPTHKALQVTGAAHTETSVAGGKCALPYWMGSQDKVYPDAAGDKAFASWRKYVAAHHGAAVACSASVKLDGLSAILVVTHAGAQLLSRGDGATAQEWSHHLPHLTTLATPIQRLQALAKKGTDGARLIVRAEAILPRAAFAKHQQAQQWTKTPRNVVSGLLNAKASDPAMLALIHLVAYEVVEPVGLAPSAQLEWLHKVGMYNVGTSLGKACNAVTLPPAFTLAELEPLFWRFREHSPYDTDGVVVTVDKPYTRNTKDNPKYAFAFKLKVNDTSQVGETVVTGVEWNVSRHGQWKPTIVVEPVAIGGVSIQRATGFNAKYIQEQRIGPGAKVRIRRCGDVIPNVVAVHAAAPKASMPPKGVCAWGASGVDLELAPPCPPVWTPLGASGTAVLRLAHVACRTEQLAHFLQVLKVPSISRKTVAKFVEHGCTDPFALLATDAATIAQWDGFAPKSSASLAGAFARCTKATAMQWLLAADALGKGLGERKLRVLVGAVPALFDIDTPIDPKGMHAALLAVPGFQQRTADALLAARPGYVTYWRKVRAHCGGTDARAWPRWDVAARAVQAAAASGASATTGPLRGKVVRFTGFRDEALAAALRAKGAEVVTGAMTKRVNTVVWDDTKGKAKSAKVVTAEAKGLAVWARSEAGGKGA